MKLIHEIEPPVLLIFDIAKKYDVKRNLQILFQFLS